ncbi:MAG: response regulator [Bdellovibrionota bacterium]
MPELLIISDQLSPATDLQALAERKGFRVKTTTTVGDALKWISIRDLHAVLVPYSTNIEAQQELAGALWRKNQTAFFIVYSPDEATVDQSNSARLNGAELISGETGLERFGELLDSMSKATENLSMSVMVVEDLDSPREIICAYVEGMGNYYVEGRASAKEAMETLINEPTRFSCIITDLRMPEIDGKQLIQFIRKHDLLKNLPVIVLTAYGTMDTLIDCLKAGATGFLAKPPKKADILRELARAQRVLQGLSNPRLATSDEAEVLRDLLGKKML